MANLIIDITTSSLRSKGISITKSTPYQIFVKQYGNPKPLALEFEQKPTDGMWHSKRQNEHENWHFLAPN
jgi:hypothetical protein